MATKSSNNKTMQNLSSGTKKNVKSWPGKTEWCVLFCCCCLLHSYYKSLAMMLWHDAGLKTVVVTNVMAAVESSSSRSSRSSNIEIKEKRPTCCIICWQVCYSASNRRARVVSWGGQTQLAMEWKNCYKIKFKTPIFQGKRRK